MSNEKKKMNKFNGHCCTAHQSQEDIFCNIMTKSSTLMRLADSSFTCALYSWWINDQSITYVNKQCAKGRI